MNAPRNISKVLPAASDRPPFDERSPFREGLDLKDIPQLLQVSEYLRTMKFKKRAVGGCDEEDVLKHFERVVSLYAEAIDLVREEALRWRREVSVRKSSLEKVQAQIHLAPFGSAQAVEIEQQLAERLEELDREYYAKSERLSASLKRIDRISRESADRARAEADALIAKARQEAERIEREAESKMREAERIEREAESKMREAERIRTEAEAAARARTDIDAQSEAAHGREAQNVSFTARHFSEGSNRISDRLPAATGGRHASSG